MMFLIAMHIPSWFFGAMLSDPQRERGLVMTIMGLAAIPCGPLYWPVPLPARSRSFLALS